MRENKKNKKKTLTYTLLIPIQHKKNLRPHLYTGSHQHQEAKENQHHISSLFPLIVHNHLTPASFSRPKRKPMHRGLPFFLLTSNPFPLQATHLLPSADQQAFFFIEPPSYHHPPFPNPQKKSKLCFLLPVTASLLFPYHYQ